MSQEPETGVNVLRGPDRDETSTPKKAQPPMCESQLRGQQAPEQASCKKDALEEARTGSLAASLASPHQMSVALPSGCDDQKSLQTLPWSPGGKTKITPS